MAAFSYQQHQTLFLDHAYLLPNNTIHMASAPQRPGDLTNNSSTSSAFLPCNYSPDTITEISTNTNNVRAYDSSSSLDTTTKVASSDHKVRGGEVQIKQNLMEKKRRSGKQMRSSNSSLSNDSTEGKKRKQKKCSYGLKDAEKSLPVAGEGEEKKQQQQPPTGYIHVRARRGQATDSHSLAERVRREKISERMKLLQGLVPGCDKVIGKALMLDEIINYVQSLQNQVEFLSMKLASVSPTLFEFGLNLDDCMVQAQKIEGMSPTVSSVQQTTYTQPTAFVETTANYPIVGTSVPFPLHGQGPSAHHQEQDFAANVDGQSRSFHHQFQCSNMCSFQ